MASGKNLRLPGEGRARRPGSGLSELETEVINLFVHLSHLLGLPRSVAEIYGLLFINPQPLTMDELIARLGLSKGSASQGLKFLRNLGAVKTVYIAGDRRDHYEAEMELRRLIGGFLKDRVGAHFDDGMDRLAQIEAVLGRIPENERGEYAARIRKLRQWEKRGQQFLPLVTRILR